MSILKYSQFCKIHSFLLKRTKSCSFHYRTLKSKEFDDFSIINKYVLFHVAFRYQYNRRSLLIGSNSSSSNNNNYCNSSSSNNNNNTSNNNNNNNSNNNMII
ncbi:hypothetical protein H8356DRAFT_1329438 [Neocallimastix lanati (nom. inval.)]|nr:hypothetical protein H8356DRAFT_1329438 [Neocallimastix sp. JGI-2020a]